MREPLPIDELADPDALRDLLGSFWAETYGGRDEVRALCAAAGDAGAQVQLDLAGLVAALARRTVPLARCERWRVLYLRRSARVPLAPAFGAAGDFGGGLSFGDIEAGGPWAWACPLSGVATIFNRLSSPGRSLTCGLDFTLAGGLILFRDDPFADPTLAARDVVDEAGEAVDRELALWCFAAEVDRGYVHQQFGYVLGLDLPSSPAYRDLVNALLDGVVGGTAIAQVREALAAIVGAPAAREDGEVVAQVFRDAHGLAVVTDRHAYRFGAGATPVVAPGQVVAAGDELADAVAVVELGRGAVPADLAALVVGPGLLGTPGEVAFANHDVSVHVDARPGLPTRVRWELGGRPEAVAAFWAEVDRRGAEAGTTLARLLDRRASPVGEPGAASLPATVNPLAFLAANILRGNGVIVRVRAGALGPDALGLEHLRLLRRLVPPHVCMFTGVELPPLDDSATMAATAGDGPEAFDAGPTLDDAATAADGQAGAWNASESCR